MSISFENLTKFIGQKVKDVYGREVGFLVHVYTEVDGTVTGVEVAYGNSFSTIEPSKINLNNDVLVVLPDWKAESMKSILQMEKIRKRQRALEELYSKQEIPKSSYDEMKRKLDAEMVKIREDYAKIKSKLKNRLNEVEDQIAHIDRAMIAVKMSYIAAELGETAYKNSIEILRQAKESYTVEKDDIRKTMEKLDLSDRDSGLDIKGAGPLTSGAEQLAKSDIPRAELPTPIPVKVLNTQ
ncbi:cell division protein [Metallosphaera tengchongensis]|uniref:Cell division protein n=1 Tax=Metallosphaera tengchongensis TaxID=1532350 RepID=A0A6N0NW15_9CREN|nr:cell division protein CdvA [Metallosphaera tengchongensis]QKQ99320.1 cell division protein [Metallosphaera tengchongensis]